MARPPILSVYRMSFKPIAQHLESLAVSHLTEALDRFEAAVRRLESVLESRDRRIATDRDRLATELQDLRTRHAALQSEARNVSLRLDAAIGRLRAALEG